MPDYFGLPMTLLGRLRRAYPKIGALTPSSTLVLLLAVGVAHAAPDPEKLYETHCLSCHAPNRLGELLPESADHAHLVKVIDAPRLGRGEDGLLWVR